MSEQKYRHIVALEAQNVKRLTAVVIKPDPQGNMVVIGGRNAQGKTSVLDAIAWAIGGANEIPAKPVREGADKATVVIDLGDIVVERTCLDSGSTTLVVKNKEGLRYSSPQSVMDSLTSKVAFDPLEFIRLKPDQQLLKLNKLTGLDFTAIDARKKRIYDDRTVLNRNAEKAKALYESQPIYPDVVAVDTEALRAELKAANDARQDVDVNRSICENADKFRADAIRGLTRVEARCLQIVDNISALQKQLEEAQVDKKECQQLVEERTKILDQANVKFKESQSKLVGTSGIVNRMRDAEAINAKVEANKTKALRLADWEFIKKGAADATVDINKLDDEKSAMIQAAKFPVVGLNVGDDGVYYNQLPFNQSSGAEQLRVSVAIAAAMNPSLRVMLVRDASLLDSDSMELLRQLAVEHNLQVWCERVGNGDQAAVIIEDGEVVG